jgi:ATP-dependent DNA helicase PIF1
MQPNATSILQTFVSTCQQDADGNPGWELAFRESKWFTRGWTLQELIAPIIVEFFSVEISYILLDLPLYVDSRVVVFVNCRNPEEQGRHIDINNDGQVNEGRSPYDKYLKRPARMEKVSFFQFLKYWNFSKKDPRTWAEWNAKPRVLKYHPRYKGDRKAKEWPDFCRTKLMLNHPYRNLGDLYRVCDSDGNPSEFDTFEAAYDHCVAVHRPRLEDDGPAERLSYDTHVLHEDDHYGVETRREGDSDDEEEFEDAEGGKNTTSSKVGRS